MNEKEVNELCDLISAAGYFNERIEGLQHLSNFHRIPDFMTMLEELNITVDELTGVLNSLSEAID